MAGSDDTTLPVEPFPEPDVPTRPVGEPWGDAVPRSERALPASSGEPSARRIVEAADRLVFFFSGFDPKGAAFYHRLLRDGIALRNASHEDSLAIGPRHRIGRWASTWTLLWRSSPDGRAPRAMRTRLHFMRWDDLVRDQWKRTALQLGRDYWNIYVRGIASGVFARVRRRARPPFWLALFPLGVLVASFATGALLAAGVLAALGALRPGPLLAFGALAGLALWRAAARWIDCEWLLRLYAFTRLQALGALPALEARQGDMATRVVEIVDARLQQPGAPPLREVLLVGYSTGSVLAASVLARALPRLRALIDGRDGSAATSLGMLTLGHCIPVATEWRAAEGMRRELQELSRCDRLVWHDYSSPADWAAFAGSPPWPRPAQLRGHQASPRFHATLGAVEYARLRRDRRELHLQYLRPPAQPVEARGYDFFMLVGGPETLAQRHAALSSRKEPAR
jgi:hypothetical protein